ncbi:phosphatidylethanolamine N-methyltransferase family protein [soil metagenome]
MNLPPAAILGMILGFSEFLLAAFKRSKGNAVSKDRHSLGLIWMVDTGAIVLAVLCAYKLPSLRVPKPEDFLKAGYCLFASGLALRWYSIVYLGRFFTTNVAIAADHRVIDSGPYGLMRHPSYTGLLIAVLGMGLSFLNWASLVLVFVPFCAVLMWRIRIEEQALAEGLGQRYTDYMGRTKRLIPFIY